jgi:DNA-directed RNA polymerase specialized sigma24 family protein
MQAPEPVDLTKLPDRQLIVRYCENRNDDGLASELWRRHNETIYCNLQKCGRRLCPTFWDPGDLIHDSYMQARRNLLKRICKFDGLDSPQNLQGWLYQLARSTMLDERRKVTGRKNGRKIIQVSFEDADGEEALIEPAESPQLPPEVETVDSEVEFASFESRTHHVYFRSRYSTRPLDPVAPVEQRIVEQERKFVFLDILVRHAANSDEDAQCSSIIRLRYWRKWSVKQVVECCYGQWKTQREFNAKYQACRRLLKENYDTIVLELDRALGIKRPEQI